MNDELNDINLLKAFQQKDAGAERAVFKRLYRPLCVYAEDITGDAAVAEDIVSETLFKAWNRRDEFKTFLHFQRFVYLIVRNAGVDHRRAEKRHHIAYAQLHYLSGQGTPPDNILDIELMRANLLQEIYTEIEQLPERCGQIFKLFFIGGLSTSEIANQLSLNIKTVQNQKLRAIGLLRTQLLKKGRIGALLLLYTLLEKM